MEPLAIRAQGLTKRFGKVLALAGVDFEVRRGTIFGLLGPNGAGKSTLIKSLVGAIRPTAGHVEVNGFFVPREARQARQAIGYMPQVPALYGDLTVRANVTFFARAHHVENLRQRVLEVVAFCGLEHKMGHRVETLSTGLKQRCSLACALVHTPDLLILDEPTAGVDPVLKAEFWRFFRGLAASGKTIVIATHLMDEPLACDRVGILREGAFVAQDTLQNLLARGRSRITLNMGEKTVVQETADPGRELPVLLSSYGLSKEVDRITIEPETLEQILLRMLQP